MSSNSPFPLFHFECTQGRVGWRNGGGRSFELYLFRRCCAGQRSVELRHQREGIRHWASALSSVDGGESASPLTSCLSVTPHDRLWSMKAASLSLSLSVCSRPPPPKKIFNSQRNETHKASAAGTCDVPTSAAKERPRTPRTQCTARTQL